MKAWLKAGLIVGGVGVCGAVALGTVSLGFWDDMPPGLMVGGRVMPKEQSLGQWLEARRTAVLARKMQVEFQGRYEEVSLGELGVSVDVGATMGDVQATLGGSFVKRAKFVKACRDGRVDLPLKFRIDEGKAKARLAQFEPWVARKAVNARLDLANRRRIADIPGRSLDVDKSLKALTALPHQNGDVLTLATKSTAAAITEERLAKVDLSQTFSAYETVFKPWVRGRTKNLEVGAKALDGYLLTPHETISFNQIVGPRTLARGFAHAPEIKGDEIVTGVGGGSCQVASTLHAAAVFGALQVKKRQSHSRPSSYIPLGLDATVAYGKVDLEIRNPFDFPLVIHAFFAKKNTIRVELLGQKPKAKVNYRYGVSSAKNFFRRVTFKRWLSPGKVHRHQKGKRGYFVVSFITTHWHDGRVVEHKYNSNYRPVPEVLWVGPGVEDESLPDMPEGASRVEFKGFRTAGGRPLPRSDGLDSRGGAEGGKLLAVAAKVCHNRAMSIGVVSSKEEFRQACRSQRAAGLRVGFVPTMGALHEGHLELVREAKRRCDWVAVSIFVNPTQFAPGEDLDQYPRDLEGDCAKVEAAGASLVFAPPPAEMYVAGECTRVQVPQLAKGLCGIARPTHFEGVATVVTKLFAIVGEATAVFGRKDYQQLQVIRRLALDLCFSVEVVGVPTVREVDGLAKSSRNAYLSPAERQRGLSLSRGLRAASEAFDGGERSAGKLREFVLQSLRAADAQVDYVTLAHPESLAEIPEGERAGSRAVLATAARFGQTRLIDNLVLGEEKIVLGQ